MSLLIGLGCSFIAGIEAGGENNSFLKYLGNHINAKTYNLGHEGASNFVAFSKLYSNYIPELNSSSDINVFWMPTGINREEVIIGDKSHYDPINLFRTVFPSPNPVYTGLEGLDILEKTLWQITHPTGYIMKFCMIAQMIKTWCESYNANLLIFPAFTRSLNRDFCYKAGKGIPYMEMIVENTPWSDFIKVDGCDNFFDWTTKQVGYKGKSMSEMHLEPLPEEFKGVLGERYHPLENIHKKLADKLINSERV